MSFLLMIFPGSHGSILCGLKVKSLLVSSNLKPLWKNYSPAPLNNFKQTMGDNMFPWPLNSSRTHMTSYIGSYVPTHLSKMVFLNASIDT
jgi:hypothetical protein